MTSGTPVVPADGLDRGAPTSISFTGAQTIVIGAAATAVTLGGIAAVHPHSFLNFLNFAVVWHTFILVFHRRELSRFSLAFAVNSVWIVCFYLVQTTVYPTSFGTTSPYGSWTDDSYFFALAADSIPAGLQVRENFQFYTAPFSGLINLLSLARIDHPMDAIFFQSGTAALLATFLGRFAKQLSGDDKLARNAYGFALVCPFLMMNGGVILIRDTLAAALLIYSLSCLFSRRYMLAGAAVALHFVIRPGTALILTPIYVVVFFGDLLAWTRRHLTRVLVTGSVLSVGLALILVPLAQPLARAAVRIFGGTVDGGAVGLLGRDLYMDLIVNASGTNRIFLAIQSQVFPVRLVLNALYMFLYPFLSFRAAFETAYFDLRSVTMSLAFPIYAFWLNAWFIAGITTRKKVISHQSQIIAATLTGYALIGTYSLQTRHTTILFPLFYLLVAMGFTSSPKSIRQFGYLCSGLLMMFQVALVLR
jgi:hypothetical protein